MARGMRLTESDKVVLEMIGTHAGGLSVREVEEKLGHEEPSEEVRKAMAHLRHCDLITRKTRGRDNLIRWVAK